MNKKLHKQVHDEELDEGFIQTIELAKDWSIPISAEEWERYLKQIESKVKESNKKENI